MEWLIGYAAADGTGGSDHLVDGDETKALAAARELKSRGYRVLNIRRGDGSFLIDGEALQRRLQQH